jgi:polyisoprenyl-teichoic acid--peptidoglycan teichoic acid transferase
VRPVDDRDRTPHGTFGPPPDLHRSPTRPAPTARLHVPGPVLRNGDTGGTPRPPTGGRPARRVEPARGAVPVPPGRPRAGGRPPSPALDGPPTDIHDEPIRPGLTGDPAAGAPTPVKRRPSPDERVPQRPRPVPEGKRRNGPAAPGARRTAADVAAEAASRGRGGPGVAGGRPDAPVNRRPAPRPTGRPDSAEMGSRAPAARPGTPADDARTRVAPAAAPPVPRRSVTRRTKVTRHNPRSFGRAMAAALAGTVIPGTGLLMIRRKRAGGLVLGVFLLAIVALVIIGLTVRKAALAANLLSSRVLLVVMVGLVLAALAWITQIVRTYALARPRGLDPARRTVGVIVVAALCLLVASPFGYAAQLVNSQRSLLNNLFGGGGGTSVADAISKPRLNVLLVGSDAGPDRTGARTDTMMLASIDTTTGRTTLFALPRNIGYAQFPPDSPMALKFPKGFHDPADPLSGDYLLNAVYAWGLDHPQDAPTTPTTNPGLNLLEQSVAYMLGVDIDYYVEVNMAGFASIIDAIGGVTVDVGPIPLPIGGVLPDGRHVKPSGYVPAGVQHLDGDQALWFARSRRDSNDYNRMGRQRCLLQSLLQQKSPTDVITHFQDIAAATTNSVATNIPQEVLGALVSLAGDKPLALQSISFDPNLPDPNQPDGRFNTSRVDVAYMREVVQNAFAATAPAPPPPPTTTPSASSSRRATATPTPTVAPTAAPAQLACGT